MLAIIQARLNSARLPGKMLMDLCGRPLLGRVIDRLSSAKTLHRIVVATSSDPSDQAIADFCAREGVVCHRGPLNDVAERLRQAAQAEAVQAFVRISGDSPLIDSALVDRAVSYYEQDECDLVTNVWVRSFPKGQSVEVLRAATFERCCVSLTPDQREHVTTVFYESPGAFRIVSFTSGVSAGAINLSIDTPDDFARIETLIKSGTGEPGNWRALLAAINR